MTPGILAACGTLFMRAGVYETTTSAGLRMWQFLLLARDGLDQQKYTAIWAGPEADSFVRAHRDRLKAGCALTVTLHRMRCITGEIVADVYAMSLAPDRWQSLRHAADDAQGQSSSAQEAAA